MDRFLAVRCIGLILISGCASAPVVQYGDPNAVETVTVDFGTTDVQMITEKMVSSLLLTPIFDESRPVIWVYPVKNKTSEHIDTKMITDAIRTQLLKSGRVRFTAASDFAKELQEQLEYQSAGSGVVDQATARQKMRQIGARFALYGEISSIVKSEGRTRLVDYRITLNLTDVESGLIEWADDKTIRKGSARRLAGR